MFGAYVDEDPEARARTIHITLAPDNGALAKALRNGERSELDQMVAQVANELAVIRAAYVPNAQADQYDSRLFLTAHRLRQYTDDRRAEIVDTTADEPGSLYSLWQG